MSSREAKPEGLPSGWLASPIKASTFPQPPTAAAAPPPRRAQARPPFKGTACMRRMRRNEHASTSRPRVFGARRRCRSMLSIVTNTAGSQRHILTGVDWATVSVQCNCPCRCSDRPASDRLARGRTVPPSWLRADRATHAVLKSGGMQCRAVSGNEKRLARAGFWTKRRVVGLVGEPRGRRC